MIMKTSMKYMVSVLAGVVALAASCQREILPPVDGMEDGYKTLQLSVSVPDMEEVATRAVDPDGGGVQNITLFCFDQYGLFVTTVSSEVTPGAADPETGVSLSGTFTVKVPQHTKTVHLVGNQNLTYFAEGHYEGMSEVEVITSIQASAGRMIYWAREDVSALTPGAVVPLVRNQAKMTVNINASTGFVENGWVVVNTSAFGTIAPYNPATGLFECPTVTNPFVTAPTDATRITGFYDVRNQNVDYFFETENSEEKPIDLIIKGSQDGAEEMYYRISLIDDDGNYVNLLRNHHYTVNIDGKLSYGQTSFDAALTAPATNNVWISISDNVPNVYDANYRLSVDETFVVIAEEEFDDPMDPNVVSLYYNIESLNGSPLSAAEVRWLEGNNVAEHAFTHDFDTSYGLGEIVVTLLDMGMEQKREGTLLVKCGRLNRKIKVITVRKQSFVPSWITTNVYGGETGENVTMMFTIPETCPEELFPLDVLVSVNELDVRNESGLALPVIRQGEPGYGADNGIGYKYVYTLTGHGVQRLFFETILNHNVDENITVTIEAEHFETLSKTATIRAAENRHILLHNLRHYSMEVPADEVIYYYLVPMKTRAVVHFPTHLGENVVWNADHTVESYTPVVPGADDEFLIYSKYLDHDASGDYELNFDFYPIDSENWSTNGRVYGFKRNNTGTPGQGAIYHMVTNAPVSAEVVRIASNPAGNASVTGSGTCAGSQYKSAVFELSNFHAFNFSTVVNGDDDGSVSLPYEPGTPVDIDIDITSFTSSIDSNQDGIPDDLADQVSVDPFGTSFKVYIDAPMLEIDDTRNGFTGSKFYEETDGRFVYVVEADREAERAYGSASAYLVDNATMDYIGNSVAVDQSGERKSLPFRTSGIVNEGKITISAEKDIVVFNEETFDVTSEVITGRVTYGPDASNQTDVPEGEFLPFEMLPTFNRIGVMTIGSGGQYMLRLRSEYIYNWDTDDVKIQYVDDAGNVYENTYDSLAELYSYTDIQLYPVTP